MPSSFVSDNQSLQLVMPQRRPRRHHLHYHLHVKHQSPKTIRLLTLMHCLTLRDSRSCGSSLLKRCVRCTEASSEVTRLIKAKLFRSVVQFLDQAGPFTGQSSKYYDVSGNSTNTGGGKLFRVRMLESVSHKRGTKDGGFESEVEASHCV